jgi:uncharacterized protein
MSSVVPGMPNGKKAGVRCIQLLDDNTCRIHETPEYPAICASLKPSTEMCGESDAEAFDYLSHLEELTRPD